MHPISIPWSRDVLQYYTTFLKLTNDQVGVARGKSEVEKENVNWEVEKRNYHCMLAWDPAFPSCQYAKLCHQYQYHDP